jgi:hypothetical protein
MCSQPWPYHQVSSCKITITTLYHFGYITCHLIHISSLRTSCCSIGRKIPCEQAIIGTILRNGAHRSDRLPNAVQVTARSPYRGTA